MQHAPLLIYDEIVHQRTIGRQSLCTHPCWPRQKISWTQVGHVALQCLQERDLAEVSIHFFKAHAPVLERQLTKTSIPQRLPEITYSYVIAMISLACACQHRIGTQP